MDAKEFEILVGRLTAEIGGVPLGASLETHLNAEYGPGSAMFEALFNACQTGVKDGWMCNREGGGIRYGRVLKATDATHGFSVDVVDMDNVVGPHHVHPNGEIDLIMPLAKNARFDSHPAGWRVYEPGSGHRPTVTEGRAMVLYLLPQGAIEFTPATV